MQDAGAFLINPGYCPPALWLDASSARAVKFIYIVRPRASAGRMVLYCSSGCGGPFLVRKFATVQAIDLGIVDEYVVKASP
jgi:hypothetical protein